MSQTPDEQIDTIVRMMVERRWRPGKSHRELAAEWGVHPRTVADRAVAASAILSRVGGDLEQWVEEKLSELDQIHAQALARTKSVVGKEGAVVTFDDPDFRSAVQAIKLQLEVRGVLTKKPAEKDAVILPGDSLTIVRDKLLAALADVNGQIAAAEPHAVNGVSSAGAGAEGTP